MSNLGKFPDIDMRMTVKMISDLDPTIDNYMRVKNSLVADDNILINETVRANARIPPNASRFRNDRGWVDPRVREGRGKK